MSHLLSWILSAAVAATLALGGCGGPPPDTESSNASLSGGSGLETWNGVRAYVYGGKCLNVYARSGTDANYTYTPGSVRTDTCGFQCVELAVRYFNFNEGIPVGNWHVGAAIDMCNSHPAGVERVSTPGVGDLMVYRANDHDPSYQTGPDGHVAVIRSVNSNGTLNVFNQRWGNESTAFTNGILPSHAACFLHSIYNRPVDAQCGCFDGDGTYCGSVVSDYVGSHSCKMPMAINNGYLYSCSGGAWSQAEACAGGCSVNPGKPDSCSCGCYEGDGDYCGAGANAYAALHHCSVPNLNPGDIYTCRGGTWSLKQTCASGCSVAPAGQADTCNCGCYAGDGQYCGANALEYASQHGCTVPNAIGGNLYSCSGGNWSLSETCANGCSYNPNGADACTPP